ncbi:MAG: hypothetical protein OHK0039_37760 [Bacteroidia bacterium]
MSDPTQPKGTDRRGFLRQGLPAAAGILAASQWAACSLLEDAELRACTLAELDAAPYLIRRFNRRQILLTRLDGEIVVFSLICRHKRCTVAYEADAEQFVCPCHEGTYDKYGEVIDGPPPGPLRRYAWELRGDEVWVRNAWLEG